MDFLLKVGRFLNIISLSKACNIFAKYEKLYYLLFRSFPI